MTLETKSYLGRCEVKDAAQGLVTAVFATTETIDRDGDYTLADAFTAGQRMVISEWNHSSVIGPYPPIGEGILRVSGHEAIVDAKLYVNLTRGREMAETLVAMGDMVEWSYAFDVIDAGTHQSVPNRVLKRLDVFEASPVWRGAGMGTRTLSSKDEEILRAAQREVDEYQGQQALQSAALHLLHLDLLGV